MILLDTNILLRYAGTTDPAFATVDTSINSLHASGEVLCVVPQNALREHLQRRNFIEAWRFMAAFPGFVGGALLIRGSPMEFVDQPPDPEIPDFSRDFTKPRRCSPQWSGDPRRTKQIRTESSRDQRAVKTNFAACQVNPTVPVVASLPPRIRLWSVWRETRAGPSAWDLHESERSRGQNRRRPQEEIRCHPPSGQRCRRLEPDRADSRCQVRH